MQKSRVKLFFDNFIVYGFGGAINKIIPFVMIIIITRLVPDSSYIGIAENTASVVQFAYQVAMLGALDAMFRFFFEKEDESYQRKVTSSALSIVLIGGVAVMAAMILFRKQLANLVYSDTQYDYLIIIAAFNQFMFAVGSIVATPTRMRNEKKRYIALNAIVPMVSYGLSVPLILMGYYAIAMPLAAMISSVVKAALFFRYNAKDFEFHCVSTDMQRKLLKLGLPIMPSFAFYWIINSSQRIIITQTMSLNMAGVYATGAKLAQVSQLIYIAFSTGWQYFAFSTMKSDDHKKLISKTSEYLGGVSFFLTCAVVAVSDWIIALLFSEEYALGASVLPALFLAPLMQMLYQSIASQFLVIKKTGYGIICLSIGAATAVSMQVVLLPKMGISGAALGALAGFTSSWVIMQFLLVRYQLIYVYPRTVIGAVVAVACVYVHASVDSGFLPELMAGLGMIVIFAMYIPEMKILFSAVKSRVN